MDMLDRIGQRMMFDAKRHEVLAGNVANAQTPGYRPKDLSSSSFGGVLGLVRTSPAHLGSADSTGGWIQTRSSTGAAPGLDGNEVDLDQERGLIASNAVDLEAQMRFATHYLRQMQTAAS